MIYPAQSRTRYCTPIRTRRAVAWLFLAKGVKGLNTCETLKATRKYVTTLLGEYAELQQKIELLKYELQCSTISGDELIEAMVLRPLAPSGIAVNSSAVSDPTARVATEYERVLLGMSEEAKASVEHDLRILQATVDRLDFYVQLLPPEQAEVIRGYYMENKSWPVLEQELGKSTRTLTDHRDKGVDALARMFQYIGSKAARAK